MTQLANHHDDVFAVEWAIAGRQAVLRLTGELDLGTVGRLEAATTAASAEGVTTMILDVSQLDFIDSTGLHHLVKVLQRQREAGGDLVVHRPTPQTLRVLELVGLNKVLTITA